MCKRGGGAGGRGGRPLGPGGGEEQGGGVERLYGLASHEGQVGVKNGASMRSC